MKTILCRFLPLLLALLLLFSTAPAALAEEADDPAGSVLDEDYLRQWMEDYCREHGLDHDWQNFSVGFCYTATGDCWYYQGDEFMYSASLYKVPVCMLAAEKEAAGEIAWTDSIQGLTLEYLETSALVYSNNGSGHALVNYLGGTYWGKCSDMSIPYTDLDESYFPRDFFDSSYYSARFMTQVMQTLYEGGEARFPHVVDCLLRAQPEAYLNLSLKDRWPVAQKYGAYDQQDSWKNNHVAALIYTPTPIIVVVMTRNVGDYQNRMAEVGSFLADYSLELDEKLAAREAEEAAAREAEEAAAREAEEAAAREAEEAAAREAEEAAAREAEEAASEPSPSPDPSIAPSPAPAPEPSFGLFAPFLIGILAGLALALFSRFRRSSGSRKKRGRTRR